MANCKCFPHRETYAALMKQGSEQVNIAGDDTTSRCVEFTSRDKPTPATAAALIHRARLFRTCSAVIPQRLFMFKLFDLAFSCVLCSFELCRKTSVESARGKKDFKKRKKKEKKKSTHCQK